MPVLYLVAIKGYALSQYQVGGVLGRGGVCGWLRDLGESVHWYARAGEQGHSDAQVNYAMAMLYGKGTRKDIAAGSDLLMTKAADKNNPKAQYLLGMLLTDGRDQVLAQSSPEELCACGRDTGLGPMRTAVAFQKGEIWV